MFFRLDNPTESLAEMQQQRKDYVAFLDANKSRFTEDTYTFARAEWHYDGNDPRGLHDAQITNLTIATHEYQTTITMYLASGWTGQIKLVYHNVRHYHLICSDKHTDGSVDDMIMDEIGLSSTGDVIHGMAFSLGDQWRITCESITYFYNGIKNGMVDGLP